ncbi:MAG TPA: response regulator [Bryobacteraceae bacterium]|nr:response regulator [Bryobacteraceae bacterium]
MKVRFWGTRGSIATPGIGTTRFGGNTSCVEAVTDSGVRFVLDCGTGARLLGSHLAASAPRPIGANILLSHTHWDHIQGFPFFVPVFVPGSRIAVYAPQGGGRSLSAVLAGQMEFTYFPVELDQLSAEITYHDLAEGTHVIDGVTVKAQYLNHPAMTLGYRIEADGVSIAYLCDHEPFSTTLWQTDSAPGKIKSILHDGDRRHAEYMSGADLVIHDAQYTPEEYPAKKNWGHSTYEYVVEVAAAAGVESLVLTHHDPAHDDVFIERIQDLAASVATARGSSMRVSCAYEGCEVVLRRGESREAAVVQPGSAPSAEGGRILIVDDDPELRALVRVTLVKGGFTVSEAASAAEALQMVGENPLVLIMLDVLMPEMDGLELLRRLRELPAARNLPVLMLTSLNDAESIRKGFDLGCTDYLSKPFSMPQLTSRVRACLARAAGVA